MDRVFEIRIAPNATRSRRGPSLAASGSGLRSYAHFLRTIAYTTGFTLCALGVVAALVTAEFRASIRSDIEANAAERRTEPAQDSVTLPVPPQPPGLVEHVAHPDLSTPQWPARIGALPQARALPSASAPAVAGVPAPHLAAHESTPRATARDPVRPFQGTAAPAGAARLTGAEAPCKARRCLQTQPGSAVAARATSQRSASRSALVPQRDTSPAPGPGVALETPGRTVAEKPEIATRASRPAETCPTCDCSGLAEKKFFTVEPMRREEQAWYGAHCEH